MIAFPRIPFSPRVVLQSKTQSLFLPQKGDHLRLYLLEATIRAHGEKALWVSAGVLDLNVTVNFHQTPRFNFISIQSQLAWNDAKIRGTAEVLMLG